MGRSKRPGSVSSPYRNRRRRKWHLHLQYREMGERTECLGFSLHHSAGWHGNRLTKGEVVAIPVLSAVENWSSGKLYPPTAENNMELEIENRPKKKINVPREQYFCHNSQLMGEGQAQRWNGCLLFFFFWGGEDFSFFFFPFLKKQNQKLSVPSAGWLGGQVL